MYSGAQIVASPGLDLAAREHHRVSFDLPGRAVREVRQGGTMLISAGDLAGWEVGDQYQSVDRALLDRVLDAGGLVSDMAWAIPTFAVRRTVRRTRPR